MVVDGRIHVPLSLNEPSMYRAPYAAAAAGASETSVDTNAAGNNGGTVAPAAPAPAPSSAPAPSTRGPPRRHSSGTQSRPNNRRPCKYFKKGTCNLGSNCPFSHARTPPKKQKRRRSRGGVLGDVTNAGGGHPAPFAPPYPHPYGYGYYVPPPPPPPRQMQAPSGADGRRGA